jgi:hypothetical protein
MAEEPPTHNTWLKTGRLSARPRPSTRDEHGRIRLRYWLPFWTLGWASGLTAGLSYGTPLPGIVTFLLLTLFGVPLWVANRLTEAPLGEADDA